MRILLIDQENCFLDFALRCVADGHEVKWFKVPVKGRKSRSGDGFKGIVQVNDWRDHMKWARDGLIMCSGNNKFLQEMDRYREFGFPIFAPSAKSAELEINRKLFMDTMKSIGVDLPPYEMFNSLEEAEAFARKSDKSYCFKTLGDEEDKSLSYVSSDPADMVGWIRNKIKRGMKLKGACMLQEKIDMLCDYGAAGWFGPEGFLPTYEISFEHKKLMNGEVGVTTGETGTLCKYVESDRLVDEMLLPLAPVLQAMGHTGDFAIGVGVDKKGRAWPFECTARLGWPDFFIRCAMNKGDQAQFMKDWLDGKNTFKPDMRPAIGVVLHQPNYPYGNAPIEKMEGNPIRGMDEVYDDLHPVEVMVAKGPKMVDGEVKDVPTFQTTGEYVMIATGLGKTIEAARKSVYKTIDCVKFPDKGFRDDIGCKVQKVLPILHEHGYVPDLESGKEE